MRPLDQTDADNFYLAEENYTLQAKVVWLQQELDAAMDMVEQAEEQIANLQDELQRLRVTKS